MWVLSFILTAGFAVYQRVTGPTYPIDGSLTVQSKELHYRLPRSSSGSDDELVKIYAPHEKISGILSWKKFVTGRHEQFKWHSEKMHRKGDTLIGRIPGQPPAGKIMYNITLNTGGIEFRLSEEPVIIRFKGEVPDFFLVLHVILIFAAMWISMRTGLQALFKGENVYKYTLWTVVILFIGGLIMGPVIQKYAFGAFWTGWPFGHDLTDNKTLVSWIMWVIALWRLRKNPNAKGWALAASIVLIAVFLIPHSLLGSELDYTQAE